MKKLYSLASTSLLAALISGCANNPPVPETGKPPEPTPADSTTNTVNTTVKLNTTSTPSDKTDQEAEVAAGNAKFMQAPAPGSDLESQPTASIKLSQKGDQIIAKVNTDWSDAKQGDLYLKWVAPKGTTCHSTQLPITKYKDSNDVSTAKRPITSLYTDESCNGAWEVKVVTKNGATVTGESINITPTTTEQPNN